MVLAVIAINTVSTGGLVAVTLRGRPASGHTAEKVDAGPGPMLRMEPLVIQLKRGPEDNGERYLRVAFDLEMRSEADRSLLLSRQARLNDSMISFFSDQTAAEMRGVNGLATIKEALLLRLQPILPGRVPRMVYITDFLIQ